MKWWQQQTTGTRIALSILGGLALMMLAMTANRMNKPIYSQDKQTVVRPAAPIPATRITKANYERLREGMKESEVMALLGPVGEVKFEAKEPSGSSAVYQWGSTGEGFIICTMGNGKLVAKTQISLRH
jgi:hypothetical protein